MMIRPLFFGLACVLGLSAWAQDGTPDANTPADESARAPDESERVPELVITATRADEADLFELPYTLRQIIAVGNEGAGSPRTITDVLRTQPNIQMQKTAYGQGSPFLRGFTGFRTLLLVDGIRMNHAVMRSGPNQYAALIDPLTLERAEVIFGPASVLYGSDAVGGAMNFITRSPELVPGTEVKAPSRLFQRYASAEQSSVTRVEAGVATRSFGLLLGGSLRDYDDLDAGKHQGTLEGTGYEEITGDVKIVQAVSPELDLTIAFQRHHQERVPRTHSTVFSQSYRGTTVGTDLARDLTQLRDLLYGRLDWDDGETRATLTLSHHHFSETENRVRSDAREQVQGFDDHMVAVAATLSTETSIGTVSTGVDYSIELVDSFFREFSSAGVPSARSRGPVADDSTYHLLGVFIEDRVPVTDDLDVIAGGRFTYVHVDADDVDPDPTDAMPFGSVSENFESVIGNLRAVYSATESVNLFAGVSQGFRAPNLSDLTRFDAARSSDVEIPAPNLKPEKFITVEVGTKVDRGSVRGGVSYYYTHIEDLIVRFPTGAMTLAGETIVTKDNVGDGFVHGVELYSECDLPNDLVGFGALSWLEGEAETFTIGTLKRKEPISRMAPASGVIGVRWEPEAPNVEIEADVRIVNEQDRLSSRDDADTQRIPPGGTPGYTVFGVRGSWQATPTLRVFAAVENIGNVDYRVHGSGSNEPGTNFIIGLDLTF